MSDLFERLAAPFPPEAVSWRVGSTTGDKTKGMALAFIDARDVMARFDEVCGPSGWERRHPHVEKTTTCEIAVWVEGRGWVVKCDGSGDTDYEAEKGSLSTAFKRAAVNWGVGRYLYDLPSPWVEIEAAGKSFKIKKGEEGKLLAILRGKHAPARIEQDAPPPGPSSAVIAYSMAISMCQNSAQLKEWWDTNKPKLDQLTDEEYRDIGQAFTARKLELKPQAVA